MNNKNTELATKLIELFDQLLPNNEILELSIPELKKDFASQVMFQILTIRFFECKKLLTPILTQEKLTDNYYFDVFYPCVQSLNEFTNHYFFRNDIPHKENILFEDVLKFSSSWFKDIINLVQNYHFVMNDFEDCQTNFITTEILSWMNETMLEEPEAKSKSSRKNTGSFYTPSEIIKYMCLRSVEEQIKVKLKDLNLYTEDDVSEIVNALFYKDNVNFKNDLKQTLIQMLKSLKIFEPSVGGESFVIHMLHLLYKTILKLNPAENKYKLKVHLIKECLYAVDILVISIAVLIL